MYTYISFRNIQNGIKLQIKFIFAQNLIKHDKNWRSSKIS